MTAAAFFDFDGVLVDSVGLKGDAFCALYADQGADVVGRVRRFHEANGGMPRRHKLAHFEQDVYGRAADPARIDDLARRFAALVEKAVIRAPSMPGAEACLERLRGVMPVFVVSATPDDELERIVAGRGWRDRLTGVHGSSRSKAEWLRLICGRHGLAPAACVMVGDAAVDYDAAQTVGMPFFGVVPPGTDGPFPAGTRCLPDLTGLAEHLLNPASTKPARLRTES